MGDVQEEGRGEDKESLCAALIDIARPGLQRPTEGNFDGGGEEVEEGGAFRS